MSVDPCPVDPGAGSLVLEAAGPVSDAEGPDALEPVADPEAWEPDSVLVGEPDSEPEGEPDADPDAVSVAPVEPEAGPDAVPVALSEPETGPDGVAVGLSEPETGPDGVAVGLFEPETGPDGVAVTAVEPETGVAVSLTPGEEVVPETGCTETVSEFEIIAVVEPLGMVVRDPEASVVVMGGIGIIVVEITGGVEMTGGVEIETIVLIPPGPDTVEIGMGTVVGVGGNDETGIETGIEPGTDTDVGIDTETGGIETGIETGTDTDTDGGIDTDTGGIETGRETETDGVGIKLEIGMGMIPGVESVLPGWLWPGVVV